MGYSLPHSFSQCTAPLHRHPDHRRGNDSSSNCTLPTEEECRSRSFTNDEEVWLTDSQAEQVSAILKGETKKTAAVLQDDSLLPMERLTKLKGFRDEEIARVSHVLDPEQLDKYTKDLQQGALPQFQPPANVPPPPPGY
jgi:hypothetical protein